jgi:hypothetical protein
MRIVSQQSTTKTLADLFRALDHQHAVTITYLDEDGTETLRTIEPYDIRTTSNGRIEIRAMCRLRGDARSFYLHQIWSRTRPTGWRSSSNCRRQRPPPDAASWSAARSSSSPANSAATTSPHAAAHPRPDRPRRLTEGEPPWATPTTRSPTGTESTIEVGYGSTHVRQARLPHRTISRGLDALCGETSGRRRARMRRLLLRPSPLHGTRRTQRLPLLPLQGPRRRPDRGVIPMPWSPPSTDPGCDKGHRAPHQGLVALQRASPSDDGDCSSRIASRVQQPQ